MNEQAKQAAGRQARWFYLLLGWMLSLLLNSLTLWGLDFGLLAGAYPGSLIYHLLSGSLLVFPLIAFLSIHLVRMPHRANRKGMWLGIATVVSLSTVLGTGAWLYLAPQTPARTAILTTHVLAVGSSLTSVWWHIRSRKKGRFHFFVPLNRQTFRRTHHWKRTTAWAFGIAHLAAMLLLVLLRPHSPEGELRQVAEVAPGKLNWDGERYLHPSVLDNSQSCGEIGCHPDIHDQWEPSAHHFSSFNNPFYTASIQYLLASNDATSARWCASCHDPLLLTTGELQNPATFADVHQEPLSQKGITCLTCHSSLGAEDIIGNGNVTLADAGYAGMGRSALGEIPGLRQRIIRSKSEPHATAMQSAFMLSDAFCTSCHKVSVPPAVNQYRWKRGQNQYDAWYQSAFSQRHPRAFYQPEPKSCVECHMPLVPSSDQGNKNGYVRSHRFAAANTALPALHGHDDQLAAVKQFLTKHHQAALDMFALVINGTRYGPGESFPVLRPNDQVEMEVLVSNKQAGHNLPAGTNDSNEWWLAVEAKDESGAAVLVSGALQERGEVDSLAHQFHAILIDKAGNLINKRNVHQWYATVLNTSIPSGMTHLVRYRWEVPAGASIHSIEVHLNQRKFKQSYHRFTFADSLLRDSSWTLPDLPILQVAGVRRAANEPDDQKTPLWRRWNDYGVALMQEENYALAMDAFEQVATWPDQTLRGQLNQARVQIEEGNLGVARTTLEACLVESPLQLQARYFLGQVLFELGEFEAAEAHWTEVETAYPTDLMLMEQFAQLHLQAGKYDLAATYAERALQIDPEYVPALYARMLIAGAKGDQAGVKSWTAAYERHKPAEAEQVAVAAFRQAYPHIQRETQRPHWHQLRPKKMP
ncbi:MAG: tetratricopeptide repeat protein [Bacteroidota bacterium]